MTPVIQFPTRLPVPLDACAESHQGLVRKNNEDFFLCRPRRGIFLIADGIGGHAGGEIASEIACKSAYEKLKQSGPTFKRLEEAFKSAHENIRAEAAAKPSLDGMGTTLIAMVIEGSVISIGHAGDSRAYMLRENRMYPLTRDHADPAQGMLTNSVGASESVLAEIGSFETFPGDVFLLCTDGLTNAVQFKDIESILINTQTAELSCKWLIDAALRGGGPDNVTVVVVRIQR